MGVRQYIRPEALWSPALVASRRRMRREWSPGELVRCRLPWGSEIEVQHDEYIGSVILTWLVFELGVCELLARLIEPGDVCVDAGANIGQMTSLLAACAGSSGRVVSFEPHPQIAQKLKRNVELFRQSSGHGQITVLEYALGAEEGTASLKQEQNFDVNPGLTSIVGSETAEHAYSVPLKRLDSIPEVGDSIGVMKIDVEDYEIEVLKGATKLLEGKAIRDIVFEDHAGYPSRVTDLLEGYGYQIYAIHRSLLRPQLVKSKKGDPGAGNYLATLDPGRAEEKFEPVGYAALRRRVG